MVCGTEEDLSTSKAKYTVDLCLTKRWLHIELMMSDPDGRDKIIERAHCMLNESRIVPGKKTLWLTVRVLFPTISNQECNVSKHVAMYRSYVPGFSSFAHEKHVGQVG